MVIEVQCVKSKRQNHFMTTKEVSILWEYSQIWGLDWQVTVGFALFRGLRIGEIVAINLYDFTKSDLSKLNVIIEKSHIMDEFPLIEEFQDLVRKYVRTNMHRFVNGYLFPYRNCPKHKHINAKTAEAKFAKMRKIIGKDHPEFLERKKHYTLKYKLIRLIDQGYIYLNDFVKIFKKRPCLIVKRLKTMIDEGLVTEKLKILPKGYRYLNNPDDCQYRYRIAFHSCRRWFETHINNVLKDRYKLRDIMRYSDVRTVDTYINPYETWKDEANILEGCLGDTFRKLNMRKEGQKSLNDW